MASDCPDDAFGFTRQEIRRLRAYSHPVNLARFDRVHPGWMTTGADLWWIPEHLVGIPHTHLLAPGMERSLSRADRRALEAGLVGYRAK